MKCLSILHMIFITVFSGRSRVAAQLSASLIQEVHPTLQVGKCTASGGCVSQNMSVVIDANWRYLHTTTSTPYNCFNDPDWNATACPDPVTCAQNCALDGARYQSDYGVYASGPNLTLTLFPQSATGSRVYLLADKAHYNLFYLKNQEFSFDVDVSGLPCGSNGALYFVNMPADGGSSQYPSNKAGATYGTGYCDAQCPQGLHFVNGQANLLNWNPGSRMGRYGSCCHEMDVWEANSVANAYTAHPCKILGPSRCDGSTSTCGSTCDMPGCDFNPYRMGNTTFYGGSATVKTTPGNLRVITQFITSTGTVSGALTEIRRFYMRTPKGTVIANANSNINGVSGNSLTDSYCSMEKQAFGESNGFATYGGMSSMDKALANGMVLTMSTFVDYATQMLWLDSAFPTSASTSKAGVVRGPCSTSTGDDGSLRSQFPNTQVKFSNLKFGDIGSTFGPPYP